MNKQRLDIHEAAIITLLQRVNEYDMRGRRRMDCIGRMVLRPSSRERASQHHRPPRVRYPRAGKTEDPV